MAGQTITNLGTAGSTLNGQSGSTTGSDTNDPKFLSWPGENRGSYVYLPAVDGNFLSVPDAAAVDTLNDFELILFVAMDDWTPSATQTLISKSGNTTEYSYNLRLLTDGTLSVLLSTNGTVNSTVFFSAPTGVVDGTGLWLRMTRNGTSGDCALYQGTDGSSWTQVGTTQTGPTGALYNSSEPVRVGGYSSSGFSPLAGKVYRVIVKSSIGGSTVLNIDPSVMTTGAATSFTATTGQTVTINRATSGLKAVAVVSAVWLFGTDDYIEVADYSLLDFAATDSFTVVAIVRQWNTQSFKALVSKIEGISAVYTGWTIYSNSTTVGTFIADGAASVADTQGYSTAALASIVGVRNVSSDNVATYVDSTSTAASTDTTTATLTNALALRVGRLAGTGSAYSDMELVAVALFRRALSTTEIGYITSYYQARLS